MPSTRRRTSVRFAPDQEHLMDELAALARRNSRDINDEIIHAITRHLAHPPSVVAPPLPSATAEKPKKRPGRPRKAKGGDS